jgi:AraC-like DNA-binding protein
VVRLALARAAAPLPVADFALALGLHRKTLWSQCRRHGVASVQVLMMWCRLIAVTRALRVRRESVERIANELEFASPTALRNATRRYLGVTPSVLREAGGEDLACAGFRRWLRGQSLPAQPSPDAASRLGVTTGDAA